VPEDYAFLWNNVPIGKRQEVCYYMVNRDDSECHLFRGFRSALMNS